MTSKRGGLIALCVFAFVVALAGGSSRYDVVQLVALRPLAAVFLGVGFYWFAWDKVAPAQRPFVLLFAFWTFWALFQLVPLPPGLWLLLPGREPIAELDFLLGLSADWRPISIAPDLGWNSWAGLVVPWAALLLALTANVRHRNLLLIVFLMGLISSLLGILQLATSGNDALYLYRITSSGRPVGLLANENHASVFSALALVIGAVLAKTARRARDPNWQRIAYYPALLLLVLAILSNGSRLGLSVGLVGILAAALVFAIPDKVSNKRNKKAKPRAWRGKFLAGFVAIIALLLVFILSGNVSGFNELTQGSLIENYRWKIIEPAIEMASVYWLLGVGFGSFAEIYKQFEPTEILLPQYVNHAHNDWLQVAIEGGLPALAMIAAFSFYAVRGLRRMISGEGLFSPYSILFGAILVLLSVVSAFDYPLRAPIFQVSLIWLLVVLIGREQ